MDEGSEVLGCTANWIAVDDMSPWAPREAESERVVADAAWVSNWRSKRMKRQVRMEAMLWTLKILLENEAIVGCGWVLRVKERSHEGVRTRD